MTLKTLLLKGYDELALLFRPILSIKHGDKLLHFIAFGLIGFGSLYLPRESVWSFAMFSAMVGIVWEMIWHYFGKSVFDKWDVLADFLGGLFFGTLFYFFVGGIPFYQAL